MVAFPICIVRTTGTTVSTAAIVSIAIATVISNNYTNVSIAIISTIISVGMTVIIIVIMNMSVLLVLFIISIIKSILQKVP